MAKSFVLISAVLASTKLTDVQEFIGFVNDAAKKVGAARPDFSISTRPLMGYFAEEATDGRGKLGRAADEAGDEGRSASRSEAAAEDGDEPKRGRGRPRKSAAADDGDGDGEARSRSASRKRSDDDADDAEGGKAARGAKPVRTREGADEGADEGEGRRGRSGGSRDDQRGDRQAARVKGGEDWGDEDEDDNGDEIDPREEAARSDDPWPNALLPKGELTKDVLASLLGAHHAATGAKDREATFDVIEKATGERALGKVDPEDYRKLAKALMKDTARYEFGLKKAAGKAKRSDD